MSSPWMAWIASNETQWRRGRKASMCSAKSSLLIKLDELEMSHTQSTPRSLWTLSEEYPRRGTSCVSLVERLPKPPRTLPRRWRGMRRLVRVHHERLNGRCLASAALLLLLTGGACTVGHRLLQNLRQRCQRLMAQRQQFCGRVVKGL